MIVLKYKAGVAFEAIALREALEAAIGFELATTGAEDEQIIGGFSSISDLVVVNFYQATEVATIEAAHPSIDCIDIDDHANVLALCDAFFKENEFKKQ